MCNRDQGPRRQLDTNWADRLAKLCALYYCLCGCVALALDLVDSLHTGRFTVVSDSSLPVMRWLSLIGFVGAGAAYVGYPRRPLWRVVAVLLPVVFGAAAGLLWALWLYRG